MRNFHRRATLTCLLLQLFSLGCVTGSKKNDAPVLMIKSTKQLFLDDFIIDEAENIRRQFHRPRKYHGNPIIEADQLFGVN